MFWAEKIFVPAGVLLVLQSVWAFADGIRFVGFVRRRQTASRGNFAPDAAVVIPCKGVDANFDVNVEAFLNQDYPSYQVIFAVATPEDLAYKYLDRLINKRQEPSSVRRRQPLLVVAGIADGRGEKVNNLLRGIQAVDQAAVVLVFADIDATPSREWLGSLVAPLASDRVTVSTGFRWYLPGKGLVSQLRAAWDTSIATMMGDHGHNFAWGGSMAIRADDFRRLRIAEGYWANSVSDDYSLTRAVRESGGRIAFEPRCLVASREESSLREFLRWSTRQIIITRVYAAHLWRLGLATYLFYCGTLTLGLILAALPGIPENQRVALAMTLCVILLLGAAKGYIRTLVARRFFGRELSGSDSCYWLLSPLVPWIMLGNFVVAGFTRRIEWRGTQYELVSRERVRVLRRSGG